jgi:5-methylcytosine-specific restriction endonuclease McrA
MKTHWQKEKHPRWDDNNYIEVTCAYCGKTFSRAIHETRGKELLFCDKVCMHRWQSENWMGENHHLWKEEAHVTKPCAQCGESVTRYQWAKNRSEKFFCSSECMYQWQSENWIGEAHPAWQGGKSFEPYSPDFNATLKAQIRARDNKTCQLCGDPETIRAHDVHHIDYDKKNNDPLNLIALCMTCHSITNGNRSYWQCLFTEIQAMRLASLEAELEERLEPEQWPLEQLAILNLAETENILSAEDH